LLCAPTSNVNLNSTVFGSVVSSSVTLNSGAAVHFDESSVCPPSLPPQLPTPLSPPPPMVNGCYERQRTGWVSIPCPDPEFIKENFPPPELPVILQSSAFVEGGVNTQIPYVYGQFQASLHAVASSEEVFVNRGIDACPSSESDSTPAACAGYFSGPANRWSFQANTNSFTGNNSSTDAVQFVLQSNGTDNPICVWNIDVDAQDYDPQCVMPRPPQRAGGFQPFDWGNIAGYID
jgi:hypothetical protein